MFPHKGSMPSTTQKYTKGNGQNSGRREALKSRGKGTRRDALLGGDKIEWYRGYSDPDTCADQSPGVRPICPSR